MKTWKLKKGADRRIRSGHPWVFNSELESSPKTIQSGEAIELVDTSGKTVAYGYGSSVSQISFRALDVQGLYINAASAEFVSEKVLQAWIHRNGLGYKNSFRVCFGEADFLPGLVIDRYLGTNGEQVIAFQVLTAGMQTILVDPKGFFKKLVERLNEKQISDIKWDKTIVVKRNDVNIRKLEGLAVEQPEVISDYSIDRALLQNFTFKHDKEGVQFTCDLLEGQKTGFFLDQSYNIEKFSQILQRVSWNQKEIKILDLCCYVGQWSTLVAYHLKKAFPEIKVAVTLVDVSDSALKFAQKNTSAFADTVEIRKLDVVHDLEQLPSQGYDLVIADPPAFIKAKKDLPNGQHAYMKMNEQAFRVVKKEGFVVSCSCSGLMTEELLQEALRKGMSRARVNAHCLFKGGHAPDHPQLVQFPEGSYLKMLVHRTI